MGLEQAGALSNQFSPQDVRQSIPAWLSTQSRYESIHPLPINHSYKHDAAQTLQQVIWPSNPPRPVEDVDYSSVASVDDDVSVVDSSHDSYSSEASSHTSWTSATESSDSFMDDDGKDHLQSLTRVNSYNTVESQDQSLRGLRTADQTGFEVSCPIASAIRGFKGRVSNFLQQQPYAEQLQQSGPACPKPWVAEQSAQPGARHCRTRRSACSLTKSTVPKLTRDTDVTEHFVAMLIVFAKRLITSIWPSSDCPPMSTECFGAGVLPLETFIRETLRRSKTSFSTLQVALYYLILLKSRMPQAQPAARCKTETSDRAQCRAMQCGRRMFLSALMLASKYLQDRNYSARAWSKISGLRSNEINENEREYLAKINYDLHLSKETFENWSKIVMILSKLSNERPYSISSSFDESLGPSARGPGASLAAMVLQVDLDDMHGPGKQVFTAEWWSQLLLKLEPRVAKDASLAEKFLQINLPHGKQHIIASFSQFNKDANTSSALPSSSSSLGSSADDDLNFGDMNSARQSFTPRTHNSQIPQTPLQMSPAGPPSLPSQPHLANLPTPQTTPRLPYQVNGEYVCPRTASLKYMRSLRRQCFRNANLERCPPPGPQLQGQSQPQDGAVPCMKQFIRSAESMQQLRSMSSTPQVTSPISVSSDSSATSRSTIRSRSSSVSSVSSWSSLGSVVPQMRRSLACGLSSPLSRVCSLSDRPSKTPSHGSQSTQSLVDEPRPTSESSQTPTSTFKPTSCAGSASSSPTSSEVAAIRGLMSLSTQSETPSQSVTPTPRQAKQISENSTPTGLQRHEWPQEHKRKLSKVDQSLQTQVRDLVWDGSWPRNNVLEDSVLPTLPYFGAMHRQVQMTTSLRTENRRPVANLLNSKRLCSLQHSSSTPNSRLLSDPQESSMLWCS
jgi:hypothetical protein